MKVREGLTLSLAPLLVEQARKNALWWEERRHDPGFNVVTEFEWLLRDLHTAGGLPNEGPELTLAAARGIVVCPICGKPHPAVGLPKEVGR